MRKLIGLALVLVLAGCENAPATVQLADGGSVTPMATLTLVSELAPGLTTTDGTRIASGKAHFYALATTTPVTVYSDATGSNPIAQPLTLTAAGTGTVYTTGAARMVVKDSLDTSTIWDLNVNTPRDDGIYVTSPSFNSGNETTLSTILDGWSTAFGGAAGYFQYKQSGGATERNPKDWMSEVHVSVKDFGAKGDNSTDDTSAIQAAISAVSSATAGVVFFPPGVYKISSLLTATSGSVWLLGSGTIATVISQTSTTLGGLSVTSASGASIHISDLTVTATTTSSGTAITAETSAGGFVLLNNVSVLLFTTGVSKSSTHSGTMYVVDSSISGSTTGLATGSSGDLTLYIGGSDIVGSNNGVLLQSSNGAVHITQSRCRATSSTSVGLSIENNVPLMVSGSYLSGGGAGHGLSIVSTAVNVFISRDTYITPNALDSRAATPIAFSVGTTSAVTPLPLITPTTVVTGTAGGITITVNNTATVVHGTEHTIMCVNASGGAVTWSFAGNYHMGSAPNPADGNRISVTFQYDAVNAHWYEVSRSGSIAN